MVIAESAYLSLIVMLVIGGVSSGLIAGLLGVGGGAIMVPVLYEVFRLSGVDEAVLYKLAIGTSLAVMVPTALRSFWAHYRYGAVDLDLLKRWSLPILLGVIIGSVIAKYVDGYKLRVLFTIVVLLIGILFAFRGRGFVLGQQILNFPMTESYGVATGLLSTLMGIGGGTFANLFFTAFNRSMHQAVATASGVGVLISVPAAMGLILAGWGEGRLPAGSLGYVNTIAVAIMLPLSLLAAPWGAKMAHAIPADKLKRIFGFFLILVSLRFLSTLF